MTINLIYVCILIIAISGYVLFVRIARRGFAFWWVSVMANVFAFLYLLGGYGDLAYAMQIVSIFIWPVLNVGGLILAIVQEQKGRKEGKINSESITKLKKSIFILTGVAFTIAIIFYISFSIFVHWLVGIT